MIISYHAQPLIREASHQRKTNHYRRLHHNHQQQNHHVLYSAQNQRGKHSKHGVRESVSQLSFLHAKVFKCDWNQCFSLK